MDNIATGSVLQHLSNPNVDATINNFIASLNVIPIANGLKYESVHVGGWNSVPQADTCGSTVCFPWRTVFITSLANHYGAGGL